MNFKYKTFFTYLLILWASLQLIIPVSPVLCVELQPQVSQISSKHSCCNSMNVDNGHFTKKVADTDNCCNDCNCVKSIPDKDVKNYLTIQQNYLDLGNIAQAFQQQIAFISFEDKLLSKDLFKPNIGLNNTILALRTVILLN